MHDAKDIELIHTKFWPALYGELGRYLLNISRKLDMIR
jgi:hypothetical protein